MVGRHWGAARHLVARDPAVAAPGRGVRISTGVCPLARRVWRDLNAGSRPKGHHPSGVPLTDPGRGGGIVTAARCVAGTGGAGGVGAHADGTITRWPVMRASCSCAVVADRRLDVNSPVITGGAYGAQELTVPGQSTAPACYRSASPRHAGLDTFGGPGVDRHRGRGNVATRPSRSRAAVARPLLFPHLSVAKNVAFGPAIECAGCFGPGALGQGVGTAMAAR